MARRITADTNIYVYALNFGGVPEQILTLARAGALELAISDSILSEIERVLTLKFHWASGPLSNALHEITSYTMRVRPNKKLEVVTADPSDNRILECAIEAQARYIVTGNSHLLRLSEYAGIRILGPSNFLQLFRDKPA